MARHSELIDNGKQYKVRASNIRGVRELTEGKEYITLNGVEAGIFADSPYISVIADDNKGHVYHAYRFEIIEEVSNG